MSDLQNYIAERKKRDAEFSENYEVGYENFKIGLKLRKELGITQEELALRLKTKKSVISRIENHAEDIRLSTLNKYAEAFGKSLKIELVSNRPQHA